MSLICRYHNEAMPTRSSLDTDTARAAMFNAFVREVLEGRQLGRVKNIGSSSFILHKLLQSQLAKLFMIKAWLK